MFSNRVAKWLYVLLGLSNGFSGIRSLIDGRLDAWSLTSGILILSLGIFMIALAIISFTPTNKFAPKFEIDENSISIRQTIFRNPKSIKWEEIKEVVYSSFELNFSLQSGKNEIITLDTNAEISILIKKAVREMADKKLIPIMGG